MPNDLATLKGKLATQLNDESDVDWSATEKNDLITWAVANLWPRRRREIDPSLASSEISLVAGTIFYAAPSGMEHIVRLDWKDADGNEGGPIWNGWEETGDPFGGTLKIKVAPVIAERGGKLRVYGYGRYNTSTALVPDDYVPLVLAKARAEAYRRMGADRARFKNWQSRHPDQDISMNELLQLINEADAEARLLDAELPTTVQRPVPGRVG